jgi:hypothetical protein
MGFECDFSRILVIFVESDWDLVGFDGILWAITGYNYKYNMLSQYDNRFNRYLNILKYQKWSPRSC